MLESGMSCRRIAWELDIGYETVGRWKQGKSPFRMT